LGIPSGASQSERTDYLMIKSQFALSYNDVARTANWVSWEVVDSDLGSVARTNDFRHDSMLPADFHVVTVADYAGSGFDRGHLCPSADRTRTRADNSATFVFTNIIPQDRAGNRGPWANFENETRRYVRAGKAVHVVAGVVNAGALGTIGSGVFVPESVFKVAVVLERGQTAADVTTTTTVIALLLPNRRGSVGERDDWATYRVPVRTIEALTRMDFLADVPKRVQDVIER
jgi:endonuclease G